MTTNRVVSSRAARSLMEKVEAEERVGNELSQQTKYDYNCKINLVARKLAGDGHPVLTHSYFWLDCSPSSAKVRSAT